MNDFINLSDSDFPLALRSIPDSPKRLYWKGTYSKEIFECCLAVVGSRKMSPYGEKVIEKVFSELSNKITIVSGFMYGVDAKAHAEAIKRGLKTIAVLPCGLDYIYPRSNTSLYQDILDSGGLLLSEYEGSMGPRTWTYLRRNRIVAGLSRAVLVVEASEKSGSLSTCEMAHTYGRDVLAIPGNIFSDLSKGCLQLIKSFAKPIVSGYEINELFNVLKAGLFKEENNSSSSLGKISEKDLIISALRAFPLTLDDLSVSLAIPITVLSSKITQLCVDGLLTESQGRFYAR